MTTEVKHKIVPIHVAILDSGNWKGIKEGDLLISAFDDKGFLVLSFEKNTKGDLIELLVLDVAKQERIYWDGFTPVNEYWDLTLHRC